METTTNGHHERKNFLNDRVADSDGSAPSLPDPDSTLAM